MRIPRRKAAVMHSVPSRREQIAAVFARATLLGVSVLYYSAQIAVSLRRHSGYKMLSATTEAAAAKAGSRATPAQEVESAEAGTDRIDPPPRQGKEQGGVQPWHVGGWVFAGDGVLKKVVTEGGDHGEAATCNMYGSWVHDEENTPMYKESDREFLVEQVTCMRNGCRSDDRRVPEVAMAARRVRPPKQGRVDEEVTAGGDVAVCQERRPAVGGTAAGIGTPTINNSYCG